MATQYLPQDELALLAVIEAMPVGVSWANLADQKIIFMNRKFTEIFGYEPGDFTDIPDWIKKTYLFAEDRRKVAAAWGAHMNAESLTEFTVDPVELRVLCKDGTIKTVINSGVILPSTGWALATFVDISERKNHELRISAAERRAAENEAIYKLLLDHSQEMIILSPFDRSRRFVSSAVEQITGFTPEEYLALKPLNTFHPEDRAIGQQTLRELQKGNLRHEFRYRILHKDGSYGWVEVVVTGYLHPTTEQVSGYIATVGDIAQQMAHEERLARENRALAEFAAIDDLTGISNRRAFNRAIANEVLRHAGSPRDLSLLMVDVDFFKRYNDFYGHLAGDACLQAIAGALQQCLRQGSDFLARFGGEEFVVLMPMTDLAGAERVALKLKETVRALAIPHAQSPHGVVTVSVGLSSWPAGIELDPAKLIDRSDQALYRAKASGRDAFAIG